MADNLKRYRFGNGSVFFKTTKDGKKIRLGLWVKKAAGNKGTIFFLNGHREFIEKYSESISFFYEKGFNIVTLDWRGWGLSERPFPNKPKIQHINDMKEYQYDLDLAFGLATENKLPKPWFMLAHSMGCLIGLRRLIINPNSFEHYAFMSPLWGNIGFLPKWLQYLLIKSKYLISSLGVSKLISSKSENYRPYPLTITFDKNTLTTDYEQFNRLRTLLSENPELHSGTPTLGFLIAILTEINALNNLSVPNRNITVFISENEQITDNLAVKNFVAKYPSIQLISIRDAKHEILIEQNKIKRKALEKIELAFRS
jgi:lysophospholipase